MSGPTKGEPEWRKLEHRVAELYRAFEFDAEVDVLLSGKQWDVVATRRFPGAGSLRICIEVKDHPGRPMPIEEVRSFFNDAVVALQGQDCDKAMLVTTGRITKNSRDVVKSHRAMEVATFAELERQLFDVAQPLHRWLNAYRSGPLSLDTPTRLGRRGRPVR